MSLKMAKVQAVAPGPVQCKGFANTLHGLLLNVFEGFLLEYSTFSDRMPGCCAVLIALNVVSFCLKITLFVVVSLVVMLCRWCLLPPCRGRVFRACWMSWGWHWNMWWHHRHFPPLQATANIVKPLTFLCVASLHTNWLWLVFKHKFFREWKPR